MGAEPQLLSMLGGTLSPDAATRQAAEAALEAGSLQPGFGAALVSVVLAGEVALGLRQLAAVVLKKWVKQHWDASSPHFSLPAVSEEEKARVREALPAGLADENRRLRTAVAMALGGIARWDVPDQWPGMLPSLIQAITSRDNANLVDGAVRTLSMFVDELAEEQVLEMAPTLLPELLHIVRSEGYGEQLQRRALQIVHCTVSVLQTLVGSSPQQVKALVAGVARDFLPEFARILGKSTSLHDVGLWGVKMECLGVMMALLSAFSKLCASHMGPAMAACWQLYGTSLPAYELLVVSGEEEEGGDIDSDGETVDFEALMSQLLEFVLAVVGNPRYESVVRGGMADMLHLALGYAQMTASQVERWDSDPNQYVADEEDDFSTVRAATEMLVDELMESFESEAPAALSSAVQRRLGEAAQAKAAGKEEWWKLREAALLAVGTASDQLTQLTKARGAQCGFDVPGFMENVLREDLVPGVPPFLLGRALWVTARLAPALAAERRTAYLAAAVAGLAPGTPLPVQIGACRAVAQLCEKAPPQELAAQWQQMFAGLCHMLQSSSEDVLHLVMETLTAAVAAAPEAAAACEAHIAEPVLNVWLQNVADPLLSVAAQDLLAALAEVPACLPALQARMLPPLGEIISNPDPHPTILVEGAVDLVTLVLAPSPPAVAQQIHAAATPHILKLLLQHEDPEILRSSSAYLRTLLQVGGADVLSWGGANPADSLTALLQPVYRLLQAQELGEHAPSHVASLLLELLRHSGPQLGPALPSLLAALAQRLSVADDTYLVQSLLTVVAQLVHWDLQRTVDCLAGMQLPSGQSALEAVMHKWCERQIEVRTAYDIRLTTTALGALLASKHPALEGIQVKGKRTDTESAVRTRARARQHAEQWSSMPLRVKLVVLLTDAFIEASTQDEGQEEEDDEWEEDEDGDEDGGGLSSAAERVLRQQPGGAVDWAALGAGTLENEVDPREESRRRADPLSGLDVAGYVADTFQRLAADQPQLFEAGAAELTPVQLQALQRLFGRQQQGQ